MTTTTNTNTPITVSSEEAFAIALAAFQKNLPIIEKKHTGQQGLRSYKYADLTDMTRICAPLLAELGLSVSSRTVIRDGRTILISKLQHSGGWNEESEVDVTAPEGNMKTLGGNITYARRYNYSTLIGVVTDEDQDAAGTSVAKHTNKAKGTPATQEQIQLLSQNANEVGRIMSTVLGRDDANAHNITSTEAEKLIKAIQTT